MYLRRINVNLYQDIKVLTHYCSTIGKPISGLDILSRVILSHTLEATSSITERLLSVILSASEESVTDPSLHFVPFKMTGSPFRTTVSLFRSR